MAKNETLHIRVNEDVKVQAEKTLNVLGISISEAVNMLLHQIPIAGGLPFDLRIPPAPESVTFRSKKELYDMLDVGMKQIQEGRVVDASVVMERMRDKYGF